MIGKWRWMRFTQVVREHLYQGKLIAYHVSLDGIIPVPNRNIWLIDDIAIPALTTGQVHNADDAVHMIFEGDEITALFPPLSQSSEETTPLHGGLLGEVVAALKDVYGDEFPNDVTPGVARVEIEQKIGCEFSRSTFHTARKKAFPESGTK